VQHENPLFYQKYNIFHKSGLFLDKKSEKKTKLYMLFWSFSVKKHEKKTGLARQRPANYTSTP